MTPPEAASSQRPPTFGSLPGGLMPHLMGPRGPDMEENGPEANLTKK